MTPAEVTKRALSIMTNAEEERMRMTEEDRECAPWMKTISGLRDQLAAEQSRREKAERVCGEAYQLAGAVGAPVKALDNLSAAANGEPIPHETFLPVVDTDCSAVSDLRSTLKECEDESWCFNADHARMDLRICELTAQLKERNTHCTKLEEGYEFYRKSGARMADQVVAAELALARMREAVEREPHHEDCAKACGRSENCNCWISDIVGLSLPASVLAGAVRAVVQAWVVFDSYRKRPLYPDEDYKAVADAIDAQRDKVFAALTALAAEWRKP